MDRYTASQLPTQPAAPPDPASNAERQRTIEEKIQRDLNDIEQVMAQKPNAVTVRKIIGTPLTGTFQVAHGLGSVPAVVVAQVENGVGSTGITAKNRSTVTVEYSLVSGSAETAVAVVAFGF